MPQSSVSPSRNTNDSVSPAIASPFAYPSSISGFSFATPDYTTNCDIAGAIASSIVFLPYQNGFSPSIGSIQSCANYCLRIPSASSIDPDRPGCISFKIDFQSPQFIWCVLFDFTVEGAIGEFCGPINNVVFYQLSTGQPISPVDPSLPLFNHVYTNLTGCAIPNVDNLMTQSIVLSVVETHVNEQPSPDEVAEECAEICQCIFGFCSADRRVGRLSAIPGQYFHTNPSNLCLVFDLHMALILAIQQLITLCLHRHSILTVSLSCRELVTQFRIKDIFLLAGQKYLENIPRQSRPQRQRSATRILDKSVDFLLLSK